MKGLLFALLVLGAATSSTALAPITPTTTPFFIDTGTLPRIVCLDATGDGGTVGTGTRISATEILTAAHVTGGRKCFADGEEVAIVLEDNANDVAILRAAPSRVTSPIGCAPPRAGRRYLAVGYGLGSQRVKIQPMTATNEKAPSAFAGMVMFRGRGAPGQSGGPIYDLETGLIVAIVNAGRNGIYDMTTGPAPGIPSRVMGRSIASMALCDGRRA